MRHDWIFDVLSDLKAYAIKNDLPALAAKVDETLTLARAEVAVQADDGAGAAGCTRPASGRSH